MPRGQNIELRYCPRCKCATYQTVKRVKRLVIYTCRTIPATAEGEKSTPGCRHPFKYFDSLAS